MPAIVTMGPYQKDKLWSPPADLEEEPNAHMNWETPNPVWWTAQSYAVIRFDSRGTGRSPGHTTLGGRQHAEDFYDAIEWCARQSWCSGRVGLLGISFFAISQWHVAKLQPPSLKAMIPWEGAADYYRDARFHGGLFCQGFISQWYVTHMAHHLLGRISQEIKGEDRYLDNVLRDMIGHSLDDVFYQDQQADWSSLNIPFLSAGNWSGMGLHLRGNIEAFMNATKAPRKLRMHAGTHYHPFYSAQGREEQLRFFDYWLKGIANGVMDEPPIKLGIRQGGGPVEWRYEYEWPLARTQWKRLYLQSGDGVESGQLLEHAPSNAHALTYPAIGNTRAGHASASATSGDGSVGRSGVSFLTPPMSHDTEVTGPLSLRLWVESSSEDMDIYVTIRNIGPDGKDVYEVGQQGYPVPVAKGWLRVSHRELDQDKSRPYRPYHKHQRRLYLRGGEVAPVDVEIWPTSMVFRCGHRIRLDIQPRDGIGSGAYTHYVADYNDGWNRLHMSAEHEAFLLLPVIPQVN
jgi:putative CocE/NonD family hydrolase